MMNLSRMLTIAAAEEKSWIQQIISDLTDWIVQLFKLLSAAVIQAFAAPFQAVADVIFDWSDSLGEWGWLAPVMFTVAVIIVFWIVYLSLQGKEWIELIAPDK